MEQQKNIVLRLTLDELDRLNAEKLGLLILPKELKIPNPPNPPRDKKELYRCGATPTVIRQIEGRYEIVEIEG